MKLNLGSFPLFLCLACGEPPEAPPASDATDAEAESCLRTKIWEANRDGWSVRNSGTAQLAGQDHKSYAVNLYTSREYQLLACGAGWAKTIGLHLYDKAGKQVMSETKQGRQPAFHYSPDIAGQFFVVVRNENTHPKTGSISWTVLYR